ncbi:MAG: glycoside hydrolase N-terminal domain-containing protein [Fibrella sp.]|nr:glycoside hydrolase N-terminal domain-containing protein [Armatimonadota bacterium]
MLLSSPFRLWYDAPATKWTQALPIGNGRLGAMIFGGPARERLQINEESLWSGRPHDYTCPDGAEILPEIRRLVFAGEWEQAQKLVNEKFMGLPVWQSAYQTVGDLYLDFGDGGFEGYSRSLDIDAATATTEYVRNGVRYKRTYFASYPDDVIVVRITADKPGAVAFTAQFETPQPRTSTVARDETLALYSLPTGEEGAPDRIHFHAGMRCLPEGKNATVVAGENGSLAVANADAVTLHIGIATAYKSYKEINEDALARVRKRLDGVRKKSYTQMHTAHLADYQPLFRRVSLGLGDQGAVSNRPTNERVADFDQTNDPALVTLHFQYGRYLLLTSSRSGNTQPANLQGIWNDQMNPPWGSKFTVNINTEMNYWPAGPANLLECYDPLLRLVHDIAETGKTTAKVQYGARG